MSDVELIKHGIALLQEWPDDRRHPVIADNIEDIQAIAASIARCREQGTVVSTLVELAYALGYQQGKQEPRDLPAL